MAAVSFGLEPLAMLAVQPVWQALLFLLLQPWLAHLNVLLPKAGREASASEHRL